MNWNARRVLITGGVSFIGSHLTDALVARGAQIRILDDLSSGRLENIQKHLKSRACGVYPGGFVDAWSRPECRKLDGDCFSSGSQPWLQRVP